MFDKTGDAIFRAHKSLLTTGIFFHIPLSPISAHANWLRIRNFAKHCVGMFKDFGNIRNSKKRCSVLFSEKKTPCIYVK